MGFSGDGTVDDPCMGMCDDILKCNAGHLLNVKFIPTKIYGTLAMGFVFSRQRARWHESEHESFIRIKPRPKPLQIGFSCSNQ